MNLTGTRSSRLSWIRISLSKKLIICSNQPWHSWMSTILRQSTGFLMTLRPSTRKMLKSWGSLAFTANSDKSTLRPWMVTNEWMWTHNPLRTHLTMPAILRTTLCHQCSNHKMPSLLICTAHVTSLRVHEGLNLLHSVLNPKFKPRRKLRLRTYRHIWSLHTTLYASWKLVTLRPDFFTIWTTLDQFRSV